MQKHSISLNDWCVENGKEILLKEWDYDNNDIPPTKISRASKIKANWICSICGNKFSMAIQNRTLNGSKCHICSRKQAHEKERKRRIKQTGSLVETNPEMLNKWDYDKNTIKPSEISRYSTIKVWWKCPTCKHEFIARVSEVRTSNNCIKCKGNQYIELGKDGKYTVYMHICPNGKKYIGCTGMPLKIRYGNGKHYSDKSLFGKAVKEFGWDNIKHEVLMSGLSKKDALEKEKEFIKLYKTTDTEYGYNVAEGGAGNVVRGKKLSEETKRKIGNSNKGKIRTKETIDKLKKSHTGKKSHHTTAVVKMDMEGNYIEEYNSIADAVRSNVRVDNTSICKCCTNKAMSAGGFKWKYRDK